MDNILPISDLQMIIIILISNNAEHLQEMLNDLNRESLKVGLKFTRAKPEL